MSITPLIARPDRTHRPSQRVLDYYTRQSTFSTPGRQAMRLDALPCDPGGVARMVQGLLIYEHVAEPFYGCPIPEGRRAESHIRSVETIIDALLALDGQPLNIARSPEKRLVGICRHFMLLAIAFFRHHGVPARGRSSFGTYFNPGMFEDHWICEYWKADEERWALLDAQFDEVFIQNLSSRHDVLDLPRDKFLLASEAWRRCRSGELDPQRFGIEFSHLRGLWFIPGSLVRDLAMLNGCEVLPWDVWGAQPRPNAELSARELEFFDELAGLVADPEANFNRLRHRFATDAKVCLPERVFNALRQREESVLAG